jgi:hypothetical protein
MLLSVAVVEASDDSLEEYCSLRQLPKPISVCGANYKAGNQHLAFVHVALPL